MANKYLDYDGLVEVASKLKETIDGKQDALKYYSEDGSNAKISANGVYIDAGTAGVNLTHGDTSLVISTINNHGGAYYNGSEVATVDDLSDYLTSTAADETYQEKLKYYSEGSGNAAISATDNIEFSAISSNSGSSIIDLSTSSIEISKYSSNNVRQTYLNMSSDITLGGGNINLDATNGNAFYNNSEIATKSDVDNLSSSFEAIVADKQDALKYYSEGSGASITLSSSTSSVGDNILLQTNGPSRSIQIETLASASNIGLSASSGNVTLTGYAIDLNTTTSSGEVRYNGEEIGTVNTNHMWLWNNTSTLPYLRQGLYPETGTPSKGDWILWLTLGSGNTASIRPCLITAVEQNGGISCTVYDSTTWSSL